MIRKLHLLILIFLLCLCRASQAQLPYNLKEGFDNKFCEPCTKLINDKPREVLFGIQINPDGDIYFLMNNKEWFDKIFKNNSYGVTVDVVSKDRYACNKAADNDDEHALPKGTMLPPVYRKDLLIGLDKTIDGQIFTKIGKLPAKLMNKQVEGNMVIVNGNLICYYTNFVDIDRSVWGLLPMGLFTDSLVQHEGEIADGEKDFFTYSKKAQLVIPFAKGSASFSTEYLKRFYDSIGLSRYNIRKAEVRAYSSVEGPEKTNRDLMNRRADSIIKVLKNYEPTLTRISKVTAENWIDFFRSIDSTENEGLKDLSKAEVKQKLTDRDLLQQLEPSLSAQRKAIVYLYLEPKSPYAAVEKDSILIRLNAAIKEKDVSKAKIIQQELAERIMDNKLPLEYLSKVEVPNSKDFSSLLNDREVYKYLLKATSEYEALDNFLALKKLDPANGKISYNVCALRFFMWQYGGDTSSKKTLLNEVRSLSKKGINEILIKRMVINYYILKSQEDLLALNYDGKDSSVNAIREIYAGIKDLRDDEIYSLAKFFTYYSNSDWAMDIIAPRADKIDASEDIVFYYLNLLFFNTAAYGSDEFQKAALNAINLNTQRFCNFFLPSDRGGASMQLLDYEEIKSRYCEVCK